LRASDSDVAQVSAGRSRQKESLAARPRVREGLGCPVAHTEAAAQTCLAGIAGTAVSPALHVPVIILGTAVTPAQHHMNAAVIVYLRSHTSLPTSISDTAMCPPQESSGLTQVQAPARNHDATHPEQGAPKPAGSEEAGVGIL